jgi:hypothetical protein
MEGRLRPFARQVHISGVGSGAGSRMGAAEALPQAIVFGPESNFAGWLELHDGIGQTRRIEVADATGQVRIIN